MTSRGPGTTGERPALQRVVVHVALRARGRLLVAPAPGGPGAPAVLPWAVLRHGETPAAGAQRALDAVGGPAARAGGAPLEVRDAVRRALGDEVPGHEDGVDLHTVHVVLPASPAEDVRAEHARPRGDGGARWAPDRGGHHPLLADALARVEPGELVRLSAPADGDAPVVRQRLAAYAVVVNPAGEILLTRLSALTPSPGRWTLPGGGVDHGEHPLTAAVREVHEETGMDVDVDGLADIGSEHFTGRSPRGVLEDFHAVRVLVTATARQVRDPRVLDVGGSTDLSSWVPLADAPHRGLVGVAHRGVQIALRRREQERLAGRGA
ncbi:NUDIX hydrolase [Kineococcus indalonis]|uniref:NUDIX hydrolase n=1 Tax=Kineococcus indalonis TaxID=2696566 RepID=UPI0014134781|nr:NUDIX hydrolase [Kineococcus indalonis]NAZ86098.1 NUDIX domain-containing protein [Kineococcus indalonis]